MESALHEIKQCLETEIQCYRDLLAVVEQERQTLLGGKHQELMNTTQAKLSLGQRLAEAQRDRRELMAQMAPADEEPPRLIELADRLDPAERGPFRDALHEADDLAKRLSEKNQVNKTFVEDALDTVDQMMGILTGRNQGPAYTARGQRQSANLPRLLAREV